MKKIKKNKEELLSITKLEKLFKLKSSGYTTYSMKQLASLKNKEALLESIFKVTSLKLDGFVLDKIIYILTDNDRNDHTKKIMALNLKQFSVGEKSIKWSNHIQNETIPVVLTINETRHGVQMLFNYKEKPLVGALWDIYFDDENQPKLENHLTIFKQGFEMFKINKEVELTNKKNTIKAL